MSVTLRLLSTHQGNKPGTIITVDDATGAQLLRGGVNATLDLTGGAAPPVFTIPNARVPALVEVTPGGVVVGIVMPDGTPVAAGGGGGTNGKTILSGAGAPGAGVGTNGDFYLDTAATALYGPKASGAWGAGVLLIGPNGKTVLNGVGVPAAGTGTNGDFYLDTAATRLYGPKAAGAWGMGVALVAAAGSTYMPHISQYDRALIFGAPVRQANAVKGFSRNINDAMYVGAITDAEVYDTEPATATSLGALSVGQASSKALAFHWGKMSWDLGTGESLLIQMRVKTVAATGTSSTHLFGNYNGTDAGLDVVLYDPANATFPGYLIVNYKAQGAAAQSMQVPAAIIGATTVTPYTIPTDTYVNITIFVDGVTRLMYVFTNGLPHINAGTTTLNAGSSLQTAGIKRNFGLGHIPTDDSFTTAAAKACRFQAFRMAVLPAGMQFANVGFLDWRFNNNPRVLFNDTDYLGAM